MKLRMIDLFAGTGCFSYVGEKHNIKCLFANDFCKESEQIYNLNHKVKLTLKDLNDVKVSDIPEHDLLCGGWPCQPFSIAGKQEGFQDSRANVFWKIIEIIKEKRPRFVILENVKNLQSHDKGKTFKIVVESITKTGYKMKYKVLNTCKIVDVPQNRERIYIVCFREEKDYEKFDFPGEMNSTNKRKMFNFLEENVPEKYYYKNNVKIYDSLVQSVTKSIKDDVIYQYRRYYVRENKSGVCPTLTANMGTGGHNVPILKDDKGIRKLTPRECYNFQGFDEEFELPDLSDSLLYKLAGNAVSMPVIEKIFEKIVSIS